MPLLKRQPFIPLPVPPDLRPDEEVFYLKVTNETFRSYEEYFDRVILCNSLIWSCALTGKAGLTFQEAVDSERAAKKVLAGFPKELKKALFYLVTLTDRGKVLDVCEDVFIYARERYFKDEVVLGVIGNLWCPSRVIRVIYPTKDEIETYKQEQIQKGEFERNDYLTDDSWGPPPDLFRYEVIETEPDNPDLNEVHILEAIDVKREKTLFTRDKCRFLIKLATEYCDTSRKWILKENVAKAFNISSVRFEDIFLGPAPRFESTLGPAPRQKLESQPKKHKSFIEDSEEKPKKRKSEKDGAAKPSKTKKVDGQGDKQRSKSLGGTPKQKANGERNSLQPEGKKKPKVKKEQKPVERKLTPQELKQLELERKAQEREKQRNEKKLIADFKKLWFKPKEDLEVEDLKDLPTPDPISCRIPNHLFGEFLAVMEFFNCYGNYLKVRDCFSSGINFDALERALTKNEVAGPLSDILQLLIKAIFRLQEAEHADISHEETAGVELEVDDAGADVSMSEAVHQATKAATWSTRYQNTPLHKLNLDHLSLSEVLRLHLLSSGATPSEKDVKWRYQNRGCFENRDDPGLRLRIEEPQILRTLSHGTVFDLSIAEKLKLISCLMNQVLTYYDIRDSMEESLEQFKQAKVKLRALQAEEKRKETEDHLWKTRLRTDRVVPDPSSLKAGAEKDKTGEEKPIDPKKMLSDEQIEALIEKKDKEIARRKQDVSWKEAELLDASNKHERKLGIHHIGRDRAYRRYWIFNTLPGLFVEVDDENIGTCLPRPTPHISDVNLNDVNFVKENMGKLVSHDREGSDKENSMLVSPKKSPKKKLQQTKGKENLAAPLPPHVFGICSGDPETCAVHSKFSKRPKWHFFWSPEQLEQLIEGLSPRGIREKDLKQVLLDEKEGILNLMKRCPVSKLNLDNIYPEYMLSIAERKQQRGGQHSAKHLDPNLGYPEGTDIEEILELQLRDLLLEMEEKVYLGTLGSLKVKDRNVWRKALEDRKYDKQTDDLSWGRSGSVNDLGKDSVKGARRQDEDDARSSASSSGNSSDVRAPVDAVPTNPAVRDLACAILQLGQSVESKFLKKPLGIKDDSKAKSKAVSVPEVKEEKGKGLSPIERWELSLMASTSLSQLFMHLFTLDNSIEWSRSVLNARCRVCRRKGDPESMLLCDECNKGHHAYCLKPALQVIPKGDWYCSECRPPEPAPKVARRTQAPKYFSDDEIGDELEEDSDTEDDDETSPRGNKSVKKSSQVNGDSEEVCEICGLGGKVMCCDNCPKLYHLLCLDPPKTRVPRGTWYCPACKGKKFESKKSSGNKSEKKKKKKRPIKRRRIVESSDEDESADNSLSEEETIDSFAENSDTNTNNESEVAEDQETDVSEDEDNNDSDEDETPKAKVKINTPFRKTQVRSDTSPKTSSSRPRTKNFASDSDEDDSDGGKGRKRKSASAAAERIAKVAKKLRSDSKDIDSDASSDSFQYSRRKRQYESDNDEGNYNTDGPKRTRLQRHNKPSQQAEEGELDNVLMDQLVKDLLKHPDAWPFLKPVTKSDAPDYFDIVKNPMDLGTIKYKLNLMNYSCNEEVISDLMLIFSNCVLYNDREHPVSKAGESLRKYCANRCRRLGINFEDDTTAAPH